VKLTATHLPFLLLHDIRSEIAARDDAQIVVGRPL
jgi:hypothetical protein